MPCSILAGVCLGFIIKSAYALNFSSSFCSSQLQDDSLVLLLFLHLFIFTRQFWASSMMCHLAYVVLMKSSIKFWSNSWTLGCFFRAFSFTLARCNYSRWSCSTQLSSVAACDMLTGVYTTGTRVEAAATFLESFDARTSFRDKVKDWVSCVKQQNVCVDQPNIHLVDSFRYEYSIIWFWCFAFKMHNIIEVMPTFLFGRGSNINIHCLAIAFKLSEILRAKAASWCVVFHQWEPSQKFDLWWGFCFCDCTVRFRALAVHCTQAARLSAPPNKVPPSQLKLASNLRQRIHLATQHFQSLMIVCFNRINFVQCC